MPPEYASTSEDEFGSNRNSSKHIRLRPGTTLRTSRLGGPAPVTTSPGGLLLKNRMKEQEEYIRDWTAHSEEISRYLSTLSLIHTQTHYHIIKVPHSYLTKKTYDVVIFMLCLTVLSVLSHEIFLRFEVKKKLKSDKNVGWFMSELVGVLQGLDLFNEKSSEIPV